MSSRLLGETLAGADCVRRRQRKTTGLVRRRTVVGPASYNHRDNRRGMKRIVVDLDHTITLDSLGAYADAAPNHDVIRTLREYKARGFEIVICTSRNMRTYEGNVGKINLHTLPVVLEWLERHDVPCDELHVAKPWCGTEGFYVDDRAVRPSEFVGLTYEEILELIAGRESVTDG